MSQLQPINTAYNVQTGMPSSCNANMQAVNPQQQIVNVSTPNGSQVYQYPQTSVYNDPSKQAASGVNIYIYNPSAIGAPNSTSTASATYNMPPAQNGSCSCGNYAQNSGMQNPISISDTNITNQQSAANNNQKTKKIVQLTDEYIKTIESYLRSQDSSVRKMGIKELINRFEEDNSRYDDAALTALLNIALQDPNENNRMIAMSPIASGSAHGDEKTIELLKKLQSSDKVYGQEAVMANNALLQAAQTVKIVPDYSPDKNVESNK